MLLANTVLKNIYKLQMEAYKGVFPSENLSSKGSDHNPGIWPRNSQKAAQKYVLANLQPEFSRKTNQELMVQRN